MRAKRILRIVAGAATGALALALVTAFLPAVQTWAASRLLQRQPGSSVKLVSVGLNHAYVVNVHMEMDGAVLDVPLAEADLSVLPAAFGGAWHFKSLRAKGWTLDLAHSRTAAAIAERPTNPWTERAVGGIVAAFKVPAGFSLDRVELEGDILFPDAGGSPAGRAHAVITGGGLSAGRDGKFACRVTAVVDDPAAPVSSVTVSSTLTVSTAQAGTLSRANMRADATASGRDFPRGIGLTFAASAAQSAGKQAFTVSLIRGTESLAEFTGANQGATALVSGTWRTDLRDTDLTPFALGRSLPAFHVAGSGDYDFDAASGDFHAEGKLLGYVDRLGVIARSLAPLGHVDIVADFDMARAGDALRVSRLETSLGDSAAPVATVRALQSFEFKPSTGELKVAVPSGDLVGISVRAMPLPWLKGLVTAVDLSGGTASGEFVMRAEDGRLVLRTRAPLKASSVSLSRSGRLAAGGLELSAFILADYATQGWQMQFAPFEVRSAGTKIVSLEMRMGRLAGAGTAVKAAGSWSASVPALLAMPFASGLPRLAAGDASGNFEASLEATRSVRLTMALANLAAPAGIVAVMPAVSTELRADFAADGKVTFNLPLRLDFGSRTPELIVSGSVNRGVGGYAVDAALSAGRISWDDLAALAILSGGGVPEPAPAADGAASPAQPDHAFWPAVSGRFALRIDELSLPRAVLHDLRGTVTLDSASLAVDAGAASLGEGSAARFDGTLAFARGDAQPYTLKANLNVDNVDAAPFFRGEDAQRLPPVEGRFAVAAVLSAKAASVGDIPGRLQGTVRLSSKDGILRVLHAEVLDSIKQDSSRIADALDTVTALFGKKTDKLGTALVETAKNLSEIHYDQMSVTAERGDDMDLRITQIAVLAPEERLSGTGKISHADGVQVRDQPLSLDMTLGVRGQVAKFMDVVGLLGDTQDDLGYTGLYQPIHLGGTLRNIDQSQWKEMLIQAPLRKGGGLFDKLLGR